jgi:hypothetical protein
MHTKHFSSVLAGAIEVSNLVLREFERGGHNETTFRFLTLWHSGHFTGSDQRSAALSANRERAKLIDRE